MAYQAGGGVVIGAKGVTNVASERKKFGLKSKKKKKSKKKMKTGK